MAIDTTRQLIQQITNATQVGENSASRVGGAMDAMLNDIKRVNDGLFGSGESGYIDLTAYTAQNAFIYQGKWMVNAQYKGKIIPCVAGEKYTFSNEGGTNTAIYCFLKSANVVSGDAVDYASGYGQPSPTVLAGAVTGEITAPSDAVYLWISVQNGSGKPNEMTSIYHQANETGLVDVVGALQAEVDVVEEDVADIQSTLNGSGESGYIDLSAYTAGQQFISAGKWFVNPYYLAKLIPCTPNTKYIISNAEGTNTAIYAFTKDNNVVSGGDVNFATGYTATRSVTAGETSEAIIAPADAAYLYISTQNGSGKPNEPTSIYHQMGDAGLVQQVEELAAKVDALDGGANIITTVRQFPNADLPVISFVFDDIVANDAQIVDLFDEYGITCGFAFIGSEAKISANKDKYLAWQRRGFSILNHSIDGSSINTTNCPTINDAYAKVATAKSNLEKAGFVVNGWVSPNSTFEESYIDVLKNLQAYAYIGSSANSRSTNPCMLSRLSLQTTLLSDLLDTNPNNQSSIAFYVATNRQLTFYGHAADLGNTYSGEVFNIAKIRQVIEHCISLRDTGKLAILNPDDMCRYFFR